MFEIRFVSNSVNIIYLIINLHDNSGYVIIRYNIKLTKKDPTQILLPNETEREKSKLNCLNYVKMIKKFTDLDIPYNNIW